MEELENKVKERYGESQVIANKSIPKSILRGLPGAHLPEDHVGRRQNPPKPDLLIRIPQEEGKSRKDRERILIFEFKCPTERRQVAAEKEAEEAYETTREQFIREGWRGRMLRS